MLSKEQRLNLSRKSLKLDVSDKLWEVFTNFCLIWVISFNEGFNTQKMLESRPEDALGLLVKPEKNL